jgi:hypothetical protein
MSFVRIAALGAVFLGCAAAEKPKPGASMCDIDGVTVEAGKTLPDRDCFVCDPAVTASDLTMLPIGTICDDGRAATTGDVCDGQGRCTGTSSPPSTCTISGESYASGASLSDNACVYCDPGNMATSWTMRKVGAACDDGRAETTGDKCDGAGRCAGVGGVVPGAAGDACGDTHPCGEALVCHEQVCRETCEPPPTGYEYCSEDVFCLEVDGGSGVCLPG